MYVYEGFYYNAEYVSSVI